MSVRGKRQGITRDDMLAAARDCDVATLPRLSAAFDEVAIALRQWLTFADEAGVAEKQATKIKQAIDAGIAQ